MHENRMDCSGESHFSATCFVHIGLSIVLQSRTPIRT